MTTMKSCGNYLVAMYSM
ncbi:unnamed protein product [Linum tenue]|uniref:Uncharacterized protein n=1 Tax=Linum tenue TaxID=586396 RepID=A0AAV0PTG9_9ROSI|nr:unnamed protein product [Linum tenue]